MTEPTLRRYECGETAFRLSRVFRDQPPVMRRFPSAVFLYRHPSGSPVLFDTGYAPTMRGSGFAGAVYSRILPPSVSTDATVDRRLHADGLMPSDVDYVVLSHLHPDHIGGVRHFPDATFVLSRGQIDALAGHSIREGIFPGLLPAWFPSPRALVLHPGDARPVGGRGLKGHDLFGDGRFVVVPLPGHARGHLGALVEGTVLLAGDAAWGRDLLRSFDDIRVLPRAIGDDHESSVATARMLEELESDGVRLFFSHDEYHESVVIGG